LEDKTSSSTSTRGDPKGVAALSTGARVPTEYGRNPRGDRGNAVGIELADEEDETTATDRNVETVDDVDHT